MQLISLLPVENYNYRGIKTMIACRSFTIVLLWSTTTSMSTYEDHFDLSGASAPYESSGENPNEDDIFTISDWKRQSFSNPHIRVARWMDSDDNVMVGCVHKGQQRGRFFLTVTGGANITIVDPHIITFKASFFNITVTPPVSITCVLNTLGQNLTSEEYTLGAHCGSEPQTPSVSLLYQLFAGFIGFVILAMTLVVIVFTLRGNRAGPDKTTECNIYEETITV
ncbi:uncharacterized protein LOC134086886 isoform X4 [Sardina pilchardus]|uniref:uncharacterized protein LOC134086886 isoform X4 n=1 Tax=Sardina pilchardus TaxID=27697 RepID=UPI002E13A65D